MPTILVNNDIVNFKFKVPKQPTPSQRKKFKKYKKQFPYDTWLTLMTLCAVKFPSQQWEIICEVEVIHNLPPITINGRTERKTNKFYIDFAIVINNKKIIYIEHDDETHRNYKALIRYDKSFKTWSDVDLEKYWKEVKVAKDNWVNAELAKKPNTAFIRLNDNKYPKVTARKLDEFLTQLTQYKTDLKVGSDWDNILTDTSLRHKEWFGYDPYDAECNVSPQQMAQDFLSVSDSTKYYLNMKPHLTGDVKIAKIISSRLISKELRRRCLILNGILEDDASYADMDKIFIYVPYQQKLSKLQHIVRCQIDYFIDDDPEIVNWCLNNGIPCFLGHHDHNKNVKTPYRIYNLQESQLTQLFNEYFFPIKNRFFQY